MGNQHIYSIIYISGVVFGILHCYPLLGEDSESPDRLDSDVIEGLHPNLPSSPRLQRLVRTLTRLVELEGQGHDASSGPDVPSFIKPDGQWEEDNGNSQGHQARRNLDDDAIDDVSRSKRQQGWYIQYGKRGADTTTEPGSVDAPNQFTRPSSSSRQIRRQVTELMASVLKDVFTLANEEQRGARHISQAAGDDGLDIDDRFADPSHLTKSKRQQGWYTQYGKRSDPDFVRL